jgi:hypothetical protein
LTPDEAKIALGIDDPDRLEILIWDVERRTFTQLPSSLESKASPLWVDNSSLVFASAETKTIWRQRVDGRSPAEQLGIGGLLSGISDGWLLFSREGSLMRMFLGGTHSVEKLKLWETRSNANKGVVSPNGSLLAYQADNAGVLPEEIYVTRYPPSTNSRPWKTSVGGGTRPLWASDGELYFVAPNGAIMSVLVDSDGQSLSKPTTALAAGPYLTADNSAARNYDVSRKTNRLLMVRNVPDQQNLAPPPIRVRLNWAEELNRLLPPSR